MTMSTPYAPSACQDESSESGKRLEMDGKTQHPKLGLYSLRGKAFIYFITYSWGERGCRACERASERANVPALWSLAWLRITSPGEAGDSDATSVPAPDTTPRPDFWPNRKSSYTLVNTLHSCGPLIFWSFDIFQLLPFPSLSFLQCHKRQKCLNNWGQRYLLAVRPLFSRHWLSAHHTECREPVRRQIISCFSP